MVIGQYVERTCELRRKPRSAATRIAGKARQTIELAIQERMGMAPRPLSFGLELRAARVTEDDVIDERPRRRLPAFGEPQPGQQRCVSPRFFFWLQYLQSQSIWYVSSAAVMVAPSYGIGRAIRDGSLPCMS